MISQSIKHCYTLNVVRSQMWFNVNKYRKHIYDTMLRYYELLTNQELDLLFLVETDTNAIMEEKVLILTLRGTF